MTGGTYIVFRIGIYDVSSTCPVFQVVITNMEASVMDLDAKKWPDAPADDPSSFYKVC